MCQVLISRNDLSFEYLKMGTNKFASQKGMTSYGTRRHLYDPRAEMENPLDQSTISLQMGTNKGASQVISFIAYQVFLPRKMTSNENILFTTFVKSKPYKRSTTIKL